jgi:AcrR family transcriptional regulator
MNAVLDAALKLFAAKGYGTTSMRQISDASGVSIGNLYHHFGSKEEIFRRLLHEHWERLVDPELRLNKIYARGRFPDDLEELAEAIGEFVEDNVEATLLIYSDLIEFRGQHVRGLFSINNERVAQIYEQSFEARRQRGEILDVEPVVAIMMAVRWFFHFYTVEKCFGVPNSFGLSAKDAAKGFIQILRRGLLPRSVEEGVSEDRSESVEDEWSRIAWDNGEN